MRNDPPEGRRLRAIRDHYEPRIDLRREHYDVLDWASAFSQEKRFEVLVRHVELAGRSLLDVGCGLGDLLGYLQARGVRTDYTGVDVSARMVEAARRLHGDGQFLQADIFADCPFPDGSFDVVFCSGVFNLNLGNNLQFAAAAVGRFLRLARRTVAFNMLHRRAAGSDPKYFHFDPAQVLPWLPAEGWESQVIDDYLPNDFTVVCRRREAP